MTCIVLHFSHETVANCLVAGIPAAARAVHQVALTVAEGHRIERCIIAVPGGWAPSHWCRAELERLAPRLNVRFADGDTVHTTGGMVHIRGEELLSARAIGDRLQSAPLRNGTWASTSGHGASVTTALRELKRKGDAIIAASGKPTDGIVSRHINRPVSRLISRMLLRLPGVKPFHATVAAAFLGLAMAASLLTGGESGLVIGAVLFQFASIIDGVDGEIARATYRSSRSGAMLDSLIDAATNLSFFAGLSFNLWLGGQHLGAVAGAIGLALLSVGLLLIGRQASASKRPFTFDGVKDHFRVNPSRLKQWLIWLTMRDFYAAAAAVCVIAGFASQMLVIFAAGAAAWFVVSVRVLVRASRSSIVA